MERDYNSGAKWLHWIVALLILTLLPLGWVMGGFTGPDKAQAYMVHKSLGIIVITLMLIRLFWRWTYTPPELPFSMPDWEKLAAKLGHLALYFLAIAMPLSGWAMSSAAQKPVTIFGLVNVPYLPWLSELPEAERKSYGGFFHEAHELMAFALAIVIAVHVIAALRHYFLLKDGVLESMAPRFGNKTTDVA